MAEALEAVERFWGVLELTDGRSDPDTTACSKTIKRRWSERNVHSQLSERVGFFFYGLLDFGSGAFGKKLSNNLHSSCA